MVAEQSDLVAFVAFAIGGDKDQDIFLMLKETLKFSLKQNAYGHAF